MSIFDKVQFVNQVWACDYSCLTRSVKTRSRQTYRFEKNYVPNKLGVKINEIKTPRTFVPKWSRYCYDNTQLRKKDRKNWKPQTNIPVYPKHLWVFAIQDVASRFILHACLRESPDDTPSYSMPYYWFNTHDCLIEVVKFQQKLGRVGYPLTFLVDGSIYVHRRTHWNGEEFGFKTVNVTESNHYLLSTIDGFFSRLQYEMRKELIAKNLRAYVNYWNFKRRVEAIHCIPAQYFFDNDNEQFFQML